MRAARERLVFACCLAVQGVAVCALAIAARHAAAPSTITLGVAASFVPYVGALIYSRSVQSAHALNRVALLCTVVFGGAFVLAPPALSDDLYRYLWEGRLWLEGLNPYHLAPDDPSLSHLRDEIWAGINNKPLATIYPPLSQALFVAAAWLGGGVSSVKLLALLGHVLAVTVLARSSQEPRAALALGLNPLLLSESALNGHFDILVGAALLVCAWGLARHRFVQAGTAACIAVGLKVIGLVVVPLFWRRPKALLATALVSGLLLAPLIASRTLADPVSGTGQFATRWHGNDSLFALVDWLSHLLFAEGRAEVVARATVVAALLALIIWVVVRRVPPLRASRVLIWGALLLSPQVHPWYLAWLIPLELAAGGHAALVWSVAVLCAYAPLDRWMVEGVWEMPPALQVFEYLVVAFALIFDPQRPSLARVANEEHLPRNSKGLPAL